MRSCRSLHRRLATLVLATPLAAGFLATGSASAQVALPPEPPVPLASLKTVPVPSIPNIATFIKDNAAAVKLGKALFWDMQVGSDGRQACASCHFAAGADTRVKNQISPGVNGGDLTFQVAGPNGTLTAAHFPFTRFTNPLDASTRASDKNDVTSSAGVLNGTYKGITAANKDNCQNVADPTFKVGTVNTRRVEPRNTPTMVNAAYNFRNFWDGRANNNFNGVNPFGQRDATAKVFQTNATGGIDEVAVAIPHSSLASQAVGPPLSFFEMSCNGRVWSMLGRRLLKTGVVPLGGQKVHINDSELGLISKQRLPVKANGITQSYTQLIQAAFQPGWWNSTQPLVLKTGVGTTTSQFKQIEANFSLFFGLAVQAYERTLIANDSPVDKFLEGTGTLTAEQQLGMVMFQTKGRCIFCHGGAETTSASVRHVEDERLERMVLGNGACGVYDDGFYNIGARLTNDDHGVGGTDPFGRPLSETGMAMLPVGDPFRFTGTGLVPPLGDIPECDSRAVVMGAFKVPGLRNVELTGPYFHNGGKATLWQVVDFYDRGGDFAADNIDFLDAAIKPIGFTDTEKNALVAFLLAFTDERTRFQKAPFDHPTLCFPSGAVGNDASVTETAAGSKKAKDVLQCANAVGRTGSTSPLVPFLNLNAFLREDPATP